MIRYPRLALVASLLFLLPLTGCSQVKKAKAALSWKYQASQLSAQESSELSKMTPDNLSCSDATWNTTKLWWECDDNPQKHGPRGILPMSAARAAHEAHKADRKWCDPTVAWGMSDGFHEYHCVPDAAGPEGRKGRVEEDFKLEQMIAEDRMHKSMLAHSLTTRVLNASEMDEVMAFGSDLFVQSNIYNPDDVQRRYVNALEIQRQLVMLQAARRELK